jgi:hypothetical protein
MKATKATTSGKCAICSTAYTVGAVVVPQYEAEGDTVPPMVHLACIGESAEPDLWPSTGALPDDRRYA